VYNATKVLDVHGHVSPPQATSIPETGRTGDDLVPVIDAFSFLSEADKIQILNGNPKKVFPTLARWDSASTRQAVTA
jgi:hypothetical protein